ncbi:hypothetical protein PTSG_07073 [Salpingoeca rosetta]|uniref:Uncharacterized protein n=1 Tax=Salpingoeca rosetta (strain ATCC 50818 / BSB-021) TaxID=946362 RepID=F2UDZ3_SALR5|nr:uncharacterized protein PTSG_07073 [Salpingoeca rosetta]EGD74843.1 hypothetical protein PTSG_07073 [Salpingoeca rosetta]|eukprot:XP_004992488.1 hypothetical protein PTSG_07073 [Salpingoeca rosetta]
MADTEPKQARPASLKNDNNGSRSKSSDIKRNKSKRTKRTQDEEGATPGRQAVVRTAACIAALVMGSWFGLGLMTFLMLSALIAFSRFRERQLKTKHKVVQNHRSLMHRSGFTTLFAGGLKQFAPSWVTYTETEKSNTVNAALELLWPSIKAATEEAVLASMTGLLAMYRPSFLSTLKFDVFELTNDPPKVVSVNQVELDDGGIALDLRITLRGESNIVLVAGARAFKASVRVQDLEVEATVRQLLSPLSSEPPFFEAMSTSFVGKPRLSYTLQAGKIPFHLERFIKHLLSEVLANQLVWPKKVVVPMVEDEAHLSYLMSSAAQGVLRVTVVRAQDLINIEALGKSDPYVKAMIRGDCDVFRTKTVFNNLNPEWNESHEFQVYNLSHDTLRISVYDHDKAGHDDIMGKCEVALDTLPADIELEMQRSLVISGKRGAGTLNLILQYKPFIFEPMIPNTPPSDIWSAGYLYVDVRKCTNIQTDKPVAVTVGYGYETGTKKTLAVAPFRGEAVYEQGFAFPIDRFSGMPTQIRFTLDRKFGTATYEFDPEDLYSHRVGQYVEVACDTDALIAVHVTLRAVNATYTGGRSIFRSGSVVSRKSALTRASVSQKLEGKGADAAALLEASIDDGWTDPASRRSSDQTTDGSRRQSSASSISTTQRRQQLAETAAADGDGEEEQEGQSSFKRYLGLARKYSVIGKQSFDGLPSDVQGAALLVGLLFVVLLFSHVWRLSGVGWVCLLSAVAFALYDAYRRASPRAPPRVNQQPDKPKDGTKLTAEEVVLLHDALPMWCKDPSWDKAEWLNELIAGIWPRAKEGIGSMIDEAIQDTVDKMQQEGTLPVDSVRVDVTFGKPPLVSALRAIKNTYINSRVMLDLDLEIGNDVHVMAHITKSKFTVPIEVRDLCLTARLRVVLRDFVPVFPCFANADVSLLSVPNFDFNLNIFHIPIMNVPFLTFGINTAVERFALRGMADMQLLWPRVFSVEIFDPNDIVVKRSLRVPPAGLLRVHIRNAKGLRKADRLSESDPYVTMIYQEGDGIKAKTKVIQDNPNPVWDEHFDFIIMNRARRYLTFTCKDYDRVGSHDTLGFAEVTTDTLMDAPDTIIERTFDFQYKGKPAGFMNVEFEFKPFQPTVDKAYFDHDREEHAIGALFVDVIRCMSLPDMQSPRVTLTVGATQLSTSSKSGSNPVYHEKFSLPVKDILTEKAVFAVVETQRLRKKQAKCSLTVELKEVAHHGVMQDVFDLEGGGRIEVRIELRTVKPDEDVTARRRLTWADYIDLRDKIEAERQEEEQTHPLVVGSKAGVGVDEEKHTPEFETENEETPAVVGAPTKPGFLLLNIIRGENLPAANSNGFSDPYVSIECEHRKKRTQWKKRTINPEWNEKLDFRINDPLNSVVTFHVKDHEHWTRNKVLGSFSVPISSVSTLKETVTNYQLENARGTITMGLMFQENQTADPKHQKKSPRVERREPPEPERRSSQTPSLNDSENEIFV